MPLPSRAPLRRALLGSLLVATAPLSAQDSTLTRLLLANRHPVVLDAGRLGGAGGAQLLAGASAARFVMIGEEHGVAETPQVVAALLRSLRPVGFNTFAIEISPLRAEELNAMTRRGRATGGVGVALDSMLAGWRTAIPFYPLSEERALLKDAMAPFGSAPPMRIWGFDYEVSADRQWLEELVTLAPPSGKAAVRAVKQRADDGFAHLLATGDPTRLFAFSAPDSVFGVLSRAFGARVPPRARAIIGLLQRTAQINRPFLAGRQYESNLDRSLFLRENFAAALRAAAQRRETPRVLFKYGGSHMMRGLNYTHTLDLGTMASMVAEAEGGSSYHVLMVGGPGTKSTRMNISRAQYESNTPAEADAPMMAWLKAAVPESGWTLFDLRAVRLTYLRGGRSTLTPVQDRFLHAYDAVLVFAGSHPGAVQVLRTAP